VDRVIFHGFQADPAPWYRNADLLLFPSQLENSPVTVLESMSYGVPALAMRGDGLQFQTANAEIVRHGADGFLADSDQDFQEQLEKLLQTPAVLRSAGKAARATVEDRYTWEQHLDRYEQVFEELVASGHGVTRSAIPRTAAALGQP
jgi:glycosyltransferase involved in cell wall biosynthesis